METNDHLETLFETESRTNKELYNQIHDRLDELGKKLNNFLASIQKQHISIK